MSLQSNISSDATRTLESVAFEEAWRQARGDRPFPQRSDIELKSFARFAPLMVIIEPDPQKVALPFRLTGSGFFDLLGFDLTGMDYLDLVDPAIKQDAYNAVVACMLHPCGLWQSTPTQIAGGERAFFELTILPISKSGDAADHVLIFVTRERRPDGAIPNIQRVEHTTIWHWIDTGAGVPEMTFRL
jgi:hypothetical protein